jgi:hypothetical protein
LALLFEKVGFAAKWKTNDQNERAAPRSTSLYGTEMSTDEEGWQLAVDFVLGNSSNTDGGDTSTKMSQVCQSIGCRL